ncbi:MAG: vacuolar iron transporter family protein [Candidatus Woesearchaeota archaeon]|nr:vacuolar iron transporter family protein [Candidatus Woesearchaeota archaeon]MDK2908310.1 vacuolar iron transporter family protein [Candidatus Woesearchaeota archaeon]
MKLSIKRGFSFGLTSGIITTLGLIVGLNSSTSSILVVISGILVIAIADSMSDALGIHMSVESENKSSTKEIWESTIATFLSKFLFALSFIVPFLFLQLSHAIIISVIWGLGLIAIFSYYMAKQENIKPYRAILEHLVIAIIVIITTHYVGEWIGTFG